MKCPHCQIDLKIADRSGIEIDYCPQCRGVWLDKGELDKIIERSQSYLAGQSEDDDYDYKSGRESDEYQRGQGPHKKKRKGSWFEEMFDIFGG